MKRFAAWLASTNAPLKGGLDLLDGSVAEDAVVFRVPSLHLKSAEMPEMGGEKGEDTGEKDEGPAVTTAKVPTMTASVLKETAPESSAELEQQSVEMLSEPTSWTKSTMRYATAAIASNISESYSLLLHSRVRAWTLLLLRHSLSSGGSESRERLLQILATNVEIESVETEFKTLPLPDESRDQSPDADVILPLLFEAKLATLSQGKKQSVVLRAPGTITGASVSCEWDCTSLDVDTHTLLAGSFGKDSSHLRSVDVRLDVKALLTNMVEQARLVVFHAVASATKTTVPAHSNGPSPEEEVVSQPVMQDSSIASAKSLAGFRSALSLSQSDAEKSPRLQKAQASALRLNSVLHGKAQDREPNETAQNLLGQRKSRSIKWDTPLQLPKLNAALAPSPKKSRRAETAARLKSFKSFGRPHGGDFGSGPRNATFGEYGRQAVWGRDGRLAHHPMPMQQAGSNDGLSNIVKAERNATFQVTASTGNKSSAGMPRTATTLENWLIRKSTA